MKYKISLDGIAPQELQHACIARDNRTGPAVQLCRCQEVQPTDIYQFLVFQPSFQQFQSRTQISAIPLQPSTCVTELFFFFLHFSVELIRVASNRIARLKKKIDITDYAVCYIHIDQQQYSFGCRSLRDSVFPQQFLQTRQHRLRVASSILHFTILV